uniref:Uncharacterized protein n=1 Tax=Arundo donax TaxID=35708 RepID=A0A0A9E0I4_ARUDO
MHCSSELLHQKETVCYFKYLKYQMGIIMERLNRSCTVSFIAAEVAMAVVVKLVAIPPSICSELVAKTADYNILQILSHMQDDGEGRGRCRPGGDAANWRGMHDCPDERERTPRTGMVAVVIPSRSSRRICP